MYLPSALSGFLHWNVCIPVLTAQELLRTRNFASRAHFYCNFTEMCSETEILSSHHLKAINGVGQNPHIVGENWILSPFSLEPRCKALQQNVRHLQRGSRKEWHSDCGCSTKNTLPVFLLQGDSLKRGEKPSLCHTPMYVTNWINSHMSASISNPPSKPEVHFQKETAVCSHIPEKSACHTPPAQPLQRKKSVKSFVWRKKENKSPRKK